MNSLFLLFFLVHARACLQLVLTQKTLLGVGALSLYLINFGKKNTHIKELDANTHQKQKTLDMWAVLRLAMRPQTREF